jgi:hypothetical protein
MLSSPIEVAAMKTAALLAVASVLLAASLSVSNASAQSAPANVPPPPGINDPGVQAVEPPAKPVARSSHATTLPADHHLNLKPQALPAMQDTGVSRNGRDASLPQVSVRQEGDNSIQEYRRNGQVYMVVITPRTGLAQTYMVDPQGRLVDEHGQKPVGPAMYKVLEWGKSKPATSSSSETEGNDGGN